MDWNMFDRVRMKLKAVRRNRRFDRFIHRVSEETWQRHQALYDWGGSQTKMSETELDDRIAHSDDQVVRLGAEVLDSFRNKLTDFVEMRVLIHMPDRHISPGGYSMFINMWESMRYLGVAVEKLDNTVPADQKNINFIFLASSNPSKLDCMESYLGPILDRYSGFICGNGWKQVNHWPSLKANKFLFARSKIGINIHLKEQSEWANELNERTYILAASGIPQLTDKPKLLPERFSNRALMNGIDMGLLPGFENGMYLLYIRQSGTHIVRGFEINYLK